MKFFIRGFLILAAGIVLGWGIGKRTQPVTGELRDSNQADASIFGVNLFYGAEARRLAGNAGITIPTNAIDSFYGVGGIKPVLEFIAFTIPKQEVWPFITSISGKKKFDGQTVPAFQGPELYGMEQYRTILFDTSGITLTNIISWEIREHLHANCAVNEISGRVFIVITPNE
jgi:hypothetical protein